MSECGSPTLSLRILSSFSRHARDDSVPTILEAFPAPPSHIPSKPPTPLPLSPLLTGNPPPSCPPSVPLPPLPGPSRFSDHDLFLLTSAGSRPTSRYSDARRDSVASSTSSGPSVRASIISVSPSFAGGRSPSIASSSSRSIRSVAPTRYPSISSAPRPSISFSISEESGESIEAYRPPPSATNSVEQLTRLAISPMPFSDDDEYDLGTSPPLMLLQSPLKLRSRSARHGHHDSISSIDMRDLPAADDDDDDDDGDGEPRPAVPPFVNAFRSLSQSQSTPSDGQRRNHHKLDAVPRKLSISIPSRDSFVSLADPIDPDTVTVHPHHAVEDQYGGVPMGSAQLITQTPGSPATVPTQQPTSTLPPNYPDPLAPNHPSPPTSSSTSSSQPSTNSTSSPSEEMSMSTSSINPQELHHEMRLARSKSVNHKQALRTRSRSKSASSRRPLAPVSEPTQPLPDLPPLPASSTPSLASTFKEPTPPPPRSPSPDIDTIISATPRPRPLRKQSSSQSSSDPDLGLGLNGSTRSSFASVGSRSRKSSNVSATSSSRARGDHRLQLLDADLRYVQGTWESVEGAGEQEHSEPGAEGEDSDSSLDLHTPLPHLMVRHGLLSPHSKLLPHAEGRSPTPYTSNGRDSTLSMGSAVTKSGIKKDERNTPMRKERHRDGRLLRGGIGLTTGLGWSDSEDEDAPSPLTRRLSALNLSTRSSASSMQSSSSYQYARTSTTSMKHPLSRSYSGGTFYHDLEGDGDGDGVDEWGQLRSRTSSSSKGAPPPTSWQGRSNGSKSRISTSSTGSTGSLGGREPRRKLSPPTDSINLNQNSNSDDTIHTPSTASSLSIPLPSTPQDEPSSASAKMGKMYNKDKTLPPLPLQPILKKQQSQTTVGTVVAGSKIAFPRSRAGSTTSSAIPSTSAPTSAAAAAAAALARVASPGPVRPLQLPQRVANSITTNSGDRPAVPVPSVPTTPRHSSFHTVQHPPPPQPLAPSRSTPGPGLSNSSSMPRLNGGRVSMPSSPTATSSLAKPRPRTGTGMAYKKSSYSSLSLNTSSTTGPAAGGGGSRIRAPMPLATASLASVTTAAMNNKPGGASGLSFRARSRTPVTPSAPTTPIGQAF